jgi:hypothetical protein
MIRLLLQEDGIVIRFAVLSDDVDVVLGFSVSEDKTLHYVHTNKDTRKQGIAKSLVPFEVEIITHLTKMGMMLWSTKLPGALFHPFF